MSDRTSPSPSTPGPPPDSPGEADSSSRDALAARRAEWAALPDGTFDVAIVGAGINGAACYHHLASNGYRVLLVDQGDIAGGTSQASAMMIWGGLLYLPTLDLPTVIGLSVARDRLIRNLDGAVSPRWFRFLHPTSGRRSPLEIRAGFWLYWLLSGGRRRSPRSEAEFPERAFLDPDRSARSILYEEGMAASSDARFVLQWILRSRGEECPVLNHCLLDGGRFDAAERVWRLELEDRLFGDRTTARARWVINAAGVWTDRVNERFGRSTAWHHVLSKGVFIGLPRDPRHESPLMMEYGDEGDFMTLEPWGPVSLWGPTETVIDRPEDGFAVEPSDVGQLLAELNRYLREPARPEQIVSLRVGVRSLAVPRSTNGTTSSLELSRRHCVIPDRDLPWISIYGGKLTTCDPVARRATRIVRAGLGASPRRQVASPGPGPGAPPGGSFPGLDEAVVPAEWAARHELCWTLDDYLRRRTNISQWVARGGLGKDDEHRRELIRIAGRLPGHAGQEPEDVVDAYGRRVAGEFDRVISGCLTEGETTHA